VACATLAVAVAEGYLAVPNASSIYLVAVVATAIAAGTIGAVITAITSMLVYNFLFTDPRHTLTVADPGEWLSLLLLLFVGVTVGQLAALQRRRAEVALAREREARALFQVTRALATRESTAAVLPMIAAALVVEAEMDRVWFALGPDDPRERVAADSGDGNPPSQAGSYAVLHRMPGPLPAKWTRVRGPAAKHGAAPSDDRGYRVRIEAGGSVLGSIWAVRHRAPEPDRTATRLLAAAADQVGQAIAQDRLALEARQAEIARQSDALKSALVESVSHDLRTPLASIRASAGTLMDPGIRLSWDDVRTSAASIDQEAERLNGLVANLLDLGRIEGGALRARYEVLDVEDLVSRAVAQVGPLIGDRVFDVDVRGAPAVHGDPVLIEEALVNVLDNAVRHTPPGTRVRVASSMLPDDRVVRLTVEDSGPGVPRDSLRRLFEKFYRVPQPGSGSRSGIGIGLAVVRGLVEAMGGRVEARVSELGGLAIDVDLPLARVPSGLTTE
jgi:two-component system sensor histidine kinase KdpD